MTIRNSPEATRKMLAEEKMRKSLIKLHEHVSARRRDELVRATEYRRVNQPVKAAYHTGLADGHNNIRNALQLILEGGLPQWLSK